MTVEQHTLFISDLHLCTDDMRMVEKFIAFTREQAIHAEALYILGDFFDAWIGDERDPSNRRILDALATLVRHDVPVYFMAGNRDFLLSLSSSSLADIDVQPLPDPYVIDLYGTKTVLTHGDLLCTADKAYQRYRRIVRLSWLNRLFLCLPLSARHLIARKLRVQSQRSMQKLPLSELDITPGEDNSLLQQYQADLLIHGHTHLPAVHRLSDDKTRIVLAAWHERGNALRYYCDPKRQPRYELIYF